MTVDRSEADAKAALKASAKKATVRKEAAKKAAKTRAANKAQKELDDTKQWIKEGPSPDLSKYEELGDTPEERRQAARAAKIAEIQAAEQSEAEAKAATRKEAGKKAAETRAENKAFKLQGELESLVADIRHSTDAEAVELLRKYLEEN